jgi:hypothetical protein
VIHLQRQGVKPKFKLRHYPPLTTVETKHEHTHIGATAIMTNGKFPWIPCFAILSARSPQKIPRSVA